MVSLPLRLDQLWTICSSASVLTSIDFIYIVSRFYSPVPLSFLVLGIWVIRFWSIGWDSGISSQQCLRIWDGFHSCEFSFFVLIICGTDGAVKNNSSLFFFGGMSIHLSTAMLAHLFSYDMYASLSASLALCSLLKWISFFPGRGAQPEKKLNVPHFGLKVGFYW